MASTNVMDWFFAPTRGKMDATALEARSVADMPSLYNQTGCSSALSPAVAMADQPGMIATGGYGMPGMGCKVDENTELKWGIEGAHRQKGPKQLWSRPFATTPFLGGGEPEAVDDESHLIHSASIRNRKESNSIMDKAIPNYFQPLIPMKASEFANPANWVESWTRGGDSARLVTQK